MKTRIAKHRNRAMTLMEAVLVVFMCALLMLMIVPIYQPSHNRVKIYKIVCQNNLKQDGLSFKVWAGDNRDRYPMEVSVTNGGTLEWMDTPDAWKTFQVMSNELSTPKVLFCFADSARENYATNFGENLRGKISYFVGCDLNATNGMSMLLSGDDNFETNGAPVKSGRLALSTNTPPSWSTARHNRTGNILLNDGSVQSATISQLRNYWQQTGFATNRLAIP